MVGRKQRDTTPNEAHREYMRSARLEHGEKIEGEAAEWLDRRGTAANASRIEDVPMRSRHRLRRPHEGPEVRAEERPKSFNASARRGEGR